MSRLLYQLSYTATTIGLPAEAGIPLIRAPMRNRTADLLLTMETLYRLSYRGWPRKTLHGSRPIREIRIRAGRSQLRAPARTP
jgi:hypothetical protein